VFQSVDMVKFTSWEWFLGKHSGLTRSFYEWDHEAVPGAPSGDNMLAVTRVWKSWARLR